VLHLQEFVRGPLNVFADLVPVSRSVEKRPQDEHVKRALEKAHPLLCLLFHRRHSTLDLAMMVDIRLSHVKWILNWRHEGLSLIEVFGSIYAPGAWAKKPASLKLNFISDNPYCGHSGHILPAK
jgi:hypothetical protein